MGAEVKTATDLITEVRDEADEYNVASKDDNAVLRMLNRGQRFVASQMVRAWQDPLLVRGQLDTSKYVSSPANPIPGTPAATGIPIPRDCFEDRILQLWVATTSTPTPVEQRTYRQVSAFEYQSAVAVPQFFYVRGRQIVTVPPMNNTYNLLVDYLRQPDALVKPIGRVVNWDPSGGAWVVVDALDTSLVSTTTTDLKSFVNVVDGLTGLVKCTLQVASIVGNKMTWRATPTYATIEGRALSANTLGLAGDFALSADDYICNVAGTCVPQLNEMVTGFLVEYAVAALARSLGQATATISNAIAEEARKFAEQQKAGRTTTRRIKSRSKVWSRTPYARMPFNK